MTAGTRLPYPGLRAFHRDESDLFFGREGHVDKMVDRLSETRFLAVLGPSGGGKSSLVKTGLLDALDLGYSKAGTAWCVAYMKPSGAPIRNLAAGLLAAVSVPAEPVDIDMLAALLRRGPRSIAEWAGNGNLPEGHCLLILADQFEELFRYGDYAGREEAEAFVKLLLEAARTPGLPLYVCITMRSEFLGACSMIPGLAEAINDGLYLTPRLSREQCEEAIVGPAGVCDFDVEPDLVNKILNDMAAMAPWTDDAEDTPQRRLSQRADQLPLMQHVLNRMWLTTSATSGKDRPLLTRKDYEALGGLKGALDIHGEEILAQLGPGRRRAAEAVFRALTTGATLETAIRRPCPLGQLASEVHDSREDVMAVIDAFRAPSANFLQPPYPTPIDDGTPIDISHESLIRQWATLSRWFKAEAQSADTWKDLLASKERHAEMRGDLLSGLDLAQASAWWAEEQPSREWAGRHGGDYDGVREFLRRSEEERDREKLEVEQRGLRERRRLKIQLVSAVAALAIVAGLGIATAVYWLKARNSETMALARSAELERKQGELVRQTAIARQRSLAATNSAREAQDAQRQAVAQRGAALTAAQAARSASAAASRSAALARSNAAAAVAAQGTLREQIDRIGEIIAGSDSSFNISSADIRNQIANAIRTPLTPTQLAQNVSATELRRKVAPVLALSLAELDRQAGTGDVERLANQDRLYQAYARAGDSVRSTQALVEGWDLSQQLRSRPWADLSIGERVLALRVAYRMAWFGDSWSPTGESEAALTWLQSVGDRYNPDSPEVAQDAQFAMMLADYEDLAAGIVRRRTFPVQRNVAQNHAMRAIRYSEIATSVVSGDQASARFRGAALSQQVNLTRNLALDLRGAEFTAATDRACALAERFYDQSPFDERALGQWSWCASYRSTPDNFRPETEMIEINGRHLETDASNRALPRFMITLASGVASHAFDSSEGCTERCSRFLNTAIEAFKEMLVQGYVPSSDDELQFMLDMLDRITDPNMRYELSKGIAFALLQLLNGTLADNHYEAALRRSLIASSQSLQFLAAATDESEEQRSRRTEAEERLGQAAALHRLNPRPISLARGHEVRNQCFTERELLAVQADLGMRDRAIETARSIQNLCERYLELVPSDYVVRDEVYQAYAKLLTLGLPGSEETVRRAERFLSEFGDGPNRENDFRFYYVEDRPGTPRPQPRSYTFRNWASSERSPVDDFLTFMQGNDVIIGPPSAVEFLRLAQATARRERRSLTIVANDAWRAADALIPQDGARTVEQLDALYQRALGSLREGRPVTVALAPAS